MRAWLFQDTRQRAKLGDKCPWSVGFYDPDGKKRSKRVGSKSQAEKLRKKIEGQLAAGLYSPPARKNWAAFRAEYESTVATRLAPRTRALVETTLDHFERIAKPAKLAAIKTQTIDGFSASRSAEAGKKRGSLVSPATVNRELRHLKAVLRTAHDWGYLPVVPKFRWRREPEEIGQVMTVEDFQSIYAACESPTMPKGLSCEPCDWWQALLVFAITTGWRISEILALRREDVDLKTGAVVTRAADNKGGRDDIDHLTPTALEHVNRIIGFGPLVFPWPHDRRTLDTVFHRIQESAVDREVKRLVFLPCPDAGQHTCTPACHLYGFHSLRRGYATLNAEAMPAAVLQRKMRHRSWATTLRYIALKDKMKAATEDVWVPDLPAGRAVS